MHFYSFAHSISLSKRYRPTDIGGAFFIVSVLIAGICVGRCDHKEFGYCGRHSLFIFTPPAAYAPGG